MEDATSDKVVPIIRKEESKHTCCAPGCNSGLAGHQENVIFHRFLPKMKLIWDHIPQPDMHDSLPHEVTNRAVEVTNRAVEATNRVEEVTNQCS